MTQRERLLTGVTVSWVALVGVVVAQSGQGCRRELLSVVFFGAIPVTLVIAALAAGAMRGNPIVVFVLAVGTVALFDLLAFLLVVDSGGCFG